MEIKKNKDINNDDASSRSSYILIGLVLSLAVIFCGIEYYTADTPEVEIQIGYNIDDEEILEFEPPENTPPPPPPPPPAAPPEEVEVLDEEDEREETQTQIIDMDADVIEVVDIPEEEEEIEVEEIFDVVEDNPEFVGGMEKLYKYLSENIKYPEMAKENSIQGRVYVQFVVWKDGSIRDVKVVRGVHATLDKEAVRVVKSMPKWTPGKQRGKPVNARFTLPIKFKIS